MSSSRLARSGRHVKGSTGQTQQIGFDWSTQHDEEELDIRIEQVNQLIEGKLPGGEESTAWQMEIDFFTQNCLKGNLPPGLDKKVGIFLQAIIRLVAQRLKCIDEPLSERMCSAMKLSLGADPQHVYFFNTYGRMSTSSRMGDLFGITQPCDGEYAVQDARSSMYLVANINLFGKLGGFQAIMDRILQRGSDDDSISSKGLHLSKESLNGTFSS